MSSLVFLAIAAGVFLIGCLFVWLRHRDRSTFDSSINEFTSNMGALSPDADPQQRRSRR